MYIYRLYLCNDFKFLDDDKTLDLSIGNMRLKDWVLAMSTLLHPGTLSKYLVTSKNVIQAGNQMINDLQQGSELNVPPGVGPFIIIEPSVAKCDRINVRN